MKIYANDSFREKRIKKGFTTVSLAKQTGTTKQAIGQFERRQNGIGPDKAKAIMEVLGVEFDDVFVLVERGLEYGEAD